MTAASSPSLYPRSASPSLPDDWTFRWPPSPPSVRRGRRAVGHPSGRLRVLAAVPSALRVARRPPCRPEEGHHCRGEEATRRRGEFSSCDGGGRDALLEPAGEADRFELWDLAGERVPAFTPFRSGSILVSPADGFAWVQDGEGTIRRWELPEGDPLAEFHYPRPPVDGEAPSARRRPGCPPPPHSRSLRVSSTAAALSPTPAGPAPLEPSTQRPSKPAG